MRRMNMTVAGMGCDHCATRVSGVLSALESVRVEGISVPMGMASVSYEPEAISPDEIAAALSTAGFPAEVPRAAQGADTAGAAERGRSEAPAQGWRPSDRGAEPRGEAR